jgi:hypothetical protein
MAAVEKELHTEMFMEDRIASLETHAEHFQKDLSRIEGKIDKLDEKIDGQQRLVAFQLETVKATDDRSDWVASYRC